MKRIFFLILSGMIGSMGLGAGTVLILYLTIFEKLPQTQAQGINLLFSLPCAALSILIYRHQKLIRTKNLLWLILPGILGAVGGYRILDRIRPELLTDIFACALIALAFYQFFGRSAKTNRKQK